MYQFINYKCNHQIVNFKINTNHMQTTLIFLKIKPKQTNIIIKMIDTTYL